MEVVHIKIHQDNMNDPEDPVEQVLLWLHIPSIDTPLNLIYNRPEYIIGIWHFNQFGIIPTCPKIL